MICNKVSIIVGGKIIDSGYMKDLLNPKIKFYEIEIDKIHRPDLKKANVEEDNVIERGKNLFIRVENENELKSIHNYLMERSINIISVIPIKETLEDLFVEKIQEKGQ